MNITRAILLSSFAFASLANSFANDPLFERQWALSNNGQSTYTTSGQFQRDEKIGTAGVDINLYKHNGALKKKEIIVAVLDSGVDIDHPELKGRIWEDPACLGKTKEEQVKLPCRGWNFLDGNSNTIDDIGHGTHIAGIIAANRDNKGIEGATSKHVKIMPLKILSSDVKSFVYKKKVITDLVADAIMFALSKKVDVINLSLGWPSLIHSKKVRYALDKAIKSNVAVVAAAGNNHKTLPVYPCSHKGVICVGAMDNQGTITDFTNYGGKVDILAPGEAILGLYPLAKESRVLRIKGIEQKNGSSQAAPFVSSVLAMMKLVHGDLKLKSMKARLYNSAKRLSSLSHGHSKYGLVDMTKSIEVLPNDFITADFKSLKVIPTINGRFIIRLPLVNLSKVDQEVNYKVYLKNKGEVVYASDQKQTLVKAVIPRNINISSTLDSDEESDLELSIEFEVNGKKTKLVTQVAFARNLMAENILTKGSTLGNAKGEVAIFKNKRKIVRLKAVGGAQKNINENLYFSFIGKKLRIVDGKSSYDKVLALKELEKVLAVFQVDINLDGKLDFFVYGLSEKRAEIYFDYFNKDGTPLFGKHSRFVFPISSFEGLPVKKGEEDFSYITLKHKVLGNIKMPMFKRGWTLPEEDNNDDFLDRLDDSKRTRVYYLSPVQEKESDDFKITVRSLESYSLFEKIREELDIDYMAPITIGQILPQTSVDKQSGEANIIIGVGYEFDQRFYKLSFVNSQKFTISALQTGRSFVENNKVLILDGDKDIHSRTLFTTLLFKNKMRVSFADNAIDWNTNDWKDPIFDILGGNTNGSGFGLFVESRYYIHHLNVEGGEVISSSKLPVNRDSSFPGVGFSESMQVVSVNNNFGLNVDSTLLYGERLYTMLSTSEGLKRPLNLSFLTPSSCANLGVRKGLKSDENVFLCQKGSQVQFRYIELGK